MRLRLLVCVPALAASLLPACGSTPSSTALLSGRSHGTPAQIMIVRHGEKPDNGPDLDARGYQRAQALAGLFTSNPAVTQYGPPAAIYAAAPAAQGDSMRSIETCTPTANALGEAIDQNYTKDKVKAAAENALRNPAAEGRSLLFCWEHKLIPSLAEALGVSNAPSTWPDETFDRVWIITYQDNRVVGFQNIPQQLLPGDSAN